MFFISFIYLSYIYIIGHRLHFLCSFILFFSYLNIVRYMLLFSFSFLFFFLYFHFVRHTLLDFCKSNFELMPQNVLVENNHLFSKKIASIL